MELKTGLECIRWLSENEVAPYALVEALVCKCVNIYSAAVWIFAHLGHSERLRLLLSGPVSQPEKTTNVLRASKQT